MPTFKYNLFTFLFNYSFALHYNLHFCYWLEPLFFFLVTAPFQQSLNLLKSLTPQFLLQLNFANTSTRIGWQKVLLHCEQRAVEKVKQYPHWNQSSMILHLEKKKTTEIHNSNRSFSTSLHNDAEHRQKVSAVTVLTLISRRETRETTLRKGVRRERSFIPGKWLMIATFYKEIWTKRPCHWCLWV